MRLPIISPDKYTDVQRSLAVDMKEGIARSFQGFINISADGALLGPWNPWLQEPEFGKPVWELTKAMAFNPSLPPAVREIAILVTGAHFKAAYEIYAHVIAAERKGLSDEKLATIVAGQRPVDLTKQEAVAYDFAAALVMEEEDTAGHRRVRTCGADLCPGDSHEPVLSRRTPARRALHR